MLSAAAPGYSRPCRVNGQSVWMIRHPPDGSRRYTSVVFRIDSPSFPRLRKLKVSTATFSAACTRGAMIS
jgi:hypothetical protein